jgi:hypothetical protein
VPSVQMLESADRDSGDTGNFLNIRYKQGVGGTTRNPLNRRVPNGTHGGVGGRLLK